MFGTRKSQKKFNEERLVEAFQPHLGNEEIQTKKKSPHASFDKIIFDKTRLLEEINSYSDNQQLNFSEIAKRYDILNKEGKK